MFNYLPNMTNICEKNKLIVLHILKNKAFIGVTISLVASILNLLLFLKFSGKVLIVVIFYLCAYIFYTIDFLRQIKLDLEKNSKSIYEKAVEIKEKLKDLSTIISELASDKGENSRMKDLSEIREYIKQIFLDLEILKLLKVKQYN